MEEIKIDEKEIKKLDKKGEEEVSGGTKLDADLIKKIKEHPKKFPERLPAVEYGVIMPGWEVSELLKNRRDEIRKAKEEPKDAIAPSEPQN